MTMPFKTEDNPIAKGLVNGTITTVASHNSINKPTNFMDICQTCQILDYLSSLVVDHVR